MYCKCLIFLFLPVCSYCIFAERIMEKDFKISEDYVIDKYYDKMIEIGAAFKLKAYIEINHHGNGDIKIANLFLGIYDEHEDGAYYRNGLLDTDFVDINGDGFKDIVVSGAVCYTDDTEIYLMDEIVLFIYFFEPGTGKFIPAYRDGSFSLDQSGEDEIVTGVGGYIELQSILGKRWAKVYKEYGIEEVSGFGENGRLEIAPGVSLDCKYTKINDRESIFETANLHLKTVKEYGITKYRDGRLTIKLCDIDRDGFKDLIVTGEVDYSVGYRFTNGLCEAVVFIYRFVPEEKSFRRIYRNASFDLENGIPSEMNTRLHEINVQIENLGKLIDSRHTPEQ